MEITVKLENFTERDLLLLADFIAGRPPGALIDAALGFGTHMALQLAAAIHNAKQAGAMPLEYVVRLKGDDDKPDAVLEDLRAAWLWFAGTSSVLRLYPDYKRVSAVMEAIGTQLVDEIVTRWKNGVVAQALAEGRPAPDIDDRVLRHELGRIALDLRRKARQQYQQRKRKQGDNGHP